MASSNTHLTSLLAAMAPGIGDLTYASAEWVDAANDVLQKLIDLNAEALTDQGEFTICEVAHNSPSYLHAGNQFSFHIKVSGDRGSIVLGELDSSECDLKIQSDHSIMSNAARIRYEGNNPSLVGDAQARLGKVARWQTEGSLPNNDVHVVLLRRLHDAMAIRTMPRFVFMTPEWVSSARHILTTRATSEKYADGIKDVVYTFSEEFTHTPAYAFPDGSHGGFWVNCNHGYVTVGAGPLPESMQPADLLTKGKYTPVVPVGRTVNAALSEEEKTEVQSYQRQAFQREEQTGEFPVNQTSPSGNGQMAPDLGRVFMVLHDELSKRTSGDLPCDFDDSIISTWSVANKFDRHPDYDTSWLNYDKFDIYGNPRQ